MRKNISQELEIVVTAIIWLSENTENSMFCKFFVISWN